MKLKPLAIAALLAGSASLPVLAAGDYGTSTDTSKPSVGERMESGAKSAAKETKSTVADAAITTKVKSKLIAKKGVAAHDIDVETENGVVSLIGFVDTQEQIDRAGKVAASVEGVKSVKNDLHLNPGKEPGKSVIGAELSDAAITTKVKAALVREKDLSAMDINVETESGVVQLGGFVDKQDQIDRATKVAEGIKGVRSVKNDLHLKAGGASMGTGATVATESSATTMESSAKSTAKETTSAVGDAAITAKVKSKLIAKKGVTAHDIDVETENGVVSLAGFVDTQEQIDRAGKVAASVKGVKSVKNDLHLNPGKEPGKSVIGTELSDAAITTKVKAALVREKDLSAMDINVETEAGIVQLGGFVSSQEQIDRATKVAEGIKGVKSVKNDLHLKTGS